MIQIIRKVRAIRLVVMLAVLGGFCGGCIFEDRDHDHHHDRDWHEAHDHY